MNHVVDFAFLRQVVVVLDIVLQPLLKDLVDFDQEIAVGFSEL